MLFSVGQHTIIAVFAMLSHETVGQATTMGMGQQPKIGLFFILSHSIRICGGGFIVFGTRITRILRIHRTLRRSIRIGHARYSIITRHGCRTLFVRMCIRGR